MADFKISDLTSASTLDGSEQVEIEQGGNSRSVTTAEIAALAGGGGFPPFGDGSDGDVTISGVVTLTRDMFYNNLTIASGAALDPAGYRIFVADTLDLSAAPAGAIKRNGNNGNNGGAGSTSPVNGAAGSTIIANKNLPGAPVSVTGGQGSVSGNGGNGKNGTAAQSGASGPSGAGGDTTSWSGGSVGVTSKAFQPNQYPLLPSGLALNNLSWIYVSGGNGSSSSGGGGAGQGASNGGGAGGSAGGDGAYIAIIAKTIARGSNTTAGIIQVKGGTGGGGGSTTYIGGGGGAGSGGGGGTVLIAFSELTGSTITGAIDVSGGAGGDGGNGNGAGSTGGGGGGSGGTGLVDFYDFGAGTKTSVFGEDGVAGTATSTASGGAGASANLKQVDL